MLARRARDARATLARRSTDAPGSWIFPGVSAVLTVYSGPCHGVFPAEERTMIVLEVTQGLAAGRTFELQGELITLGRSSDNRVVLDDRQRLRRARAS